MLSLYSRLFRSSLPDRNSTFVHRSCAKLRFVHVVVIASCQTIWSNRSLLMKNVESEIIQLFPPRYGRLKYCVLVTWLTGLEARRGREISLRLQWNSGRSKMADTNALFSCCCQLYGCIFVWRSPLKMPLSICQSCWREAQIAGNLLSALGPRTTKLVLIRKCSLQG